ncbi:MAG: NADH-quinone oxidoreductase subunit NuoE [Acidobacteria bacterium]|nr:NADH-quinone oxidoreductase subunit NuoE [Acidobacteriota bacterium]
MLSETACKQIQDLIGKYPRKRSALIPSLHLVQKELGFISRDAMREVAEIFELSPNEVHEVTSFYTMFHRKPVGKYVIQVCTNISCQLCNAEDIMAHLMEKLGIKPGETSSDNKYTLLEVECLGSCGTSPVVQINEDYYEELTPEKLDKILDSLE